MAHVSMSLKGEVDIQPRFLFGRVEIWELWKRMHLKTL